MKKRIEQLESQLAASRRSKDQRTTRRTKTSRHAAAAPAAPARSSNASGHCVSEHVQPAAATAGKHRRHASTEHESVSLRGFGQLLETLAEGGQGCHRPSPLP